MKSKFGMFPHIKATKWKWGGQLDKFSEEAAGTLMDCGCVERPRIQSMCSVSA